MHVHGLCALVLGIEVSVVQSGLGTCGWCTFLNVLWGHSIFTHRHGPDVCANVVIPPSTYGRGMSQNMQWLGHRVHCWVCT
jgi:hypothetical protein